MSVQGYLWDIGSTEDIDIGPNENQTISEINIESSEHPVTVDVGEIVEAGATLPSESSHYNIKNGQTAADSEVSVQNPNSSNATVVVSSSSLDDTDTFDLEISGINTTNISKYDQNLSKHNTNMSYTVQQNGYKEPARFDIDFSQEVAISTESYNDSTENITLSSLKLDRSNYDEVVIWNLTPGGELNERLGSSQENVSEINVNSSLVSGETDVAVTVNLNTSKTDQNTIYAVETGTITIPVTPKLVQTPVYYSHTNSGITGQNTVLDLSYNTDIERIDGNISVNYSAQSNETIILNNKSNYTVSEGDIQISLSSTNSNNLQPHIEDIMITGVVSTTGGKSSSQELQPTHVGETVSNKTSISLPQGTDVAIVSNNSSSQFIEFVSNSTIHNISKNSSSVTIFNTSNIPTDEYTLRSESQINGTSIQIVDPNVSVDISEDNIINESQIRFENISTARQFLISVNKNTGDYQSTSEYIINTSRDPAVPIEVPAEGTYHIEINDVNTNYSTSKSVSVVENKSTNFSVLSDHTQLAVGTDIVLELEELYDTSRIKLINPENQSTAATITLETTSDGTVPIGFNTYAAGNSSLGADLVTTGPNATVASVETSTPSGTLPPGTYDLAVRSTHGTVTTADNATVTFEGRSTDDVSAYTTTALDPDALGTAAEVRTAIDGGTLSPSTTVSDEQTVVYAVNASGLSGLPTARDAALDTGADLDRFDGLAFGVRPNATATDEATASELDAETDDGTVGSVPDNATVHLDETGLYLVTTGADALATDEPPADGDAYTATFRVDDDRLQRAAESGTGHAVTTDLTYVEPDAERDLTEGDAAGSVGAGAPSGGGGSVSGGGSAGGGAGGGTGGGGATGAGSGAVGGDERAPEDPDIDTGDGEPKTAVTDGTAGTDGRNVAAGARGFDIVPLDADTGATIGDRPAGVTAVADLRAPYRDHPNAVLNGTASEWSTESGSTGGSDESDDTDADINTDAVADPDTPDYENAPIRSTAYDVPGFGPVATLLAIAMASLLARRRP